MKVSIGLQRVSFQLRWLLLVSGDFLLPLLHPSTPVPFAISAVLILAVQVRANVSASPVVGGFILSLSLFTSLLSDYRLEVFDVLELVLLLD